MKRTITGLLGWLLFLTVLFSMPVYADAGPKPSIQVDFEHMSSEKLCYGTLLSKIDSTGPASAWDGVSAYDHDEYGEAGKKIWEAFVSYQDAGMVGV